MLIQNPISKPTWSKLAQLQPQLPWATNGVFATAVGENFTPMRPGDIFYVGKAGGPLIDNVSLTRDQDACAKAALRWMMHTRNPRSSQSQVKPSPFWNFIDRIIGHDRSRLAWSNVCKIDSAQGVPPTSTQWRDIAAPCIAALREEIETLRPFKTVFATGSNYRSDIQRLLQEIGYTQVSPSGLPAETLLYMHKDGRSAYIIGHPQGKTTAVLRPIEAHIAAG